MKIYPVSIMLTLALCLGMLAAQAQNPQWAQFHYDIENTGLCPYFGPDSSATKWVLNLPNYVQSSPVIAEDGTIYVGCHDGNLYAVNPNGLVKWSYQTGDQIWGAPAISSTNGTIYFGSYDDYFYAIQDAGDSAVFLWSQGTGGNISASPVIGPDDKIYVGAWDDKFYAFYPNGTIAWTYTATDWFAFSSPAIDPVLERVYVGCYDDSLYAFDFDGHRIWTYPMGGNVWSAPAVGQDGTIYVGSYDDQLHAVNPDGSEKWTYLTGSNVLGSPAIGADGTIYIGSNDDFLYAIQDAGDSAVMYWAFHTAGNVQNGPAVDANGDIYFGSTDDYIYAIRPDNSLKWSYLTGSNVVSSPAIATDGTMYCGTQANALLAFGGNCGDENGDGGVTSADGYQILNHFGDPITFPVVSCWAANVNGDGGLTTADGYHLLNYLGDPVTFPLTCGFCIPSGRR